MGTREWVCRRGYRMSAMPDATREWSAEARGFWEKTYCACLGVSLPLGGGANRLESAAKMADAAMTEWRKRFDPSNEESK
jgi:hypothetical protein